MKKKLFGIVLFFCLLILSGCNSGDGEDNPPQTGVPVITTQPANLIVTAGQTAQFSVVATGTGTLHYQWKKGSNNVGTDSASYVIVSAQTADSGSYSVTVSDNEGRSVPSSIAILEVTPDEISDRSFTFGVWMQDPGTIYNGKTNAQNYKDIGINTFLGLWAWPSEHNMYSGYAVDAMQALKDAGLIVYAGNDQAAVDWINARPEFADTIAGYILGDEPDMNKVNGAPGDQPDAWKAAGDALHAADPTRGIYANFGKGFALDPWAGYHVSPGSTRADDFAKYVSPLSVISSDFYGITDPWEGVAEHGVWTYGRAVQNTINYAGNRPVWGLVEASAPWRDDENAGPNRHQMYERMPPSLVMPIVWNMVVHGAQGIVYFCHDFSSSGLGYYAALREPGMPQAMMAANESVMAFGAVLKTASVPGTTVTTNGAVSVVALTKRFNGSTYIFAMGHGNSTYRHGLAVDAEITVSGETGSKSVEVLNGSRTITMTNGRISDHFEPYQLHIYKF